MVEVTGGEWPRGTTNTSKVRNPQGIVLIEGEQPRGRGVLAEGKYPYSLKGGLLAEGEQPRVGMPASGE